MPMGPALMIQKKCSPVAFWLHKPTCGTNFIDSHPNEATSRLLSYGSETDREYCFLVVRWHRIFHYWSKMIILLTELYALALAYQQDSYLSPREPNDVKILEWEGFQRPLFQDFEILNRQDRPGQKALLRVVKHGHSWSNGLLCVSCNALIIC